VAGEHAPQFQQAWVWLSIAWIVCAVVLSSAAWIWAQDSAVNLEFDQPYVTQFKLLVYSLFFIQGCRGVNFLLKTRSPIGLIFAAQGLALVLSAVAGGDAFYGGQALVGFFGVTLGALGTYRTLGPWRTFNLIANVILVILVASVLVSILTPQIGQHGAPFQGVWRGMFNNKNFLGQLAFFGLVTSWPYWRHRRYHTRAAIGAGVAMLCLWGSVSGTSISVALISTALLFLFFVTRKLGVSQRATLIILFAAALASYFLQSAFLELFVTSLGKDLTFTGRDEIWTHMWEIGAERPLFGHGPYYLIIDQITMDWLRNQVIFPQLRSAHNSYVETFVEAGAFGLATMVLAYGTIIWRWGITQAHRGELAMLVIAAVVPVAIYNNFESANHLFAGLGTFFVNFVLIDSFRESLGFRAAGERSAGAPAIIRARMKRRSAMRAKAGG
jgi:O-antigen ligase